MRPGILTYIRGPILQPVAGQGAPFHQSNDGFRHASNLQHNLTSGTLMRLTQYSAYRGIVDLLAVTVKRPGTSTYPGIPSILDVILRDPTLYFIFMFVGQLLPGLF